MELLIRWTQTGLLHPRFIMNSWKPDGIINCPWLHEDGLPAIRDALRLRYRLMPYLYSLMHAAAANAEPIIRPTFWDFDTDPATSTDCDDLMLGAALLAAPVVKPGARRRAVYLPAGPEVWFGFHDGTLHSAGKTATVDAPP